MPKDIETPSIVFPKSMLAAVDRAAAKERRNRSFIVREAVQMWLAVRGEPYTPDEPDATASSEPVEAAS